MSVPGSWKLSRARNEDEKHSTLHLVNYLFILGGGRTLDQSKYFTDDLLRLSHTVSERATCKRVFTTHNGFVTKLVAPPAPAAARIFLPRDRP